MLTSDAVGGIWNYSLALAEGLASEGAFCSVAILGPPPSSQQAKDARDIGLRILDTGLDLDWLVEEPQKVITAGRRLAVLAAQECASVAHLHTPLYAAADGWRCPTIAVVHSSTATWWHAVHETRLPVHWRWREDLMMNGLSRADAIVAPTTTFARQLRAVYRFAGEITIIYNGVPSLPARDIPAHDNGVLTVGRLWDAGKNMRTLDEAASLIDHPVHAIGACNGPDGSTFVPRALHTSGSIAACEVRAAYDGASVFAAPSLYEPFGLAVLEAAVAGLPLVLADISTFRELWDEAAMFVPARDAKAWARALDELMRSDVLRSLYGSAAQARAGRYSRDRMVTETLLLHNKLCADASGQV